jgi:hypothetical protein
MDIWLLIITAIIILFGLFGVPSPYGKIGKKVKKGYAWSRGLATIVYNRFYVKGSLAESFFYFVEEFENFISSNYIYSFLCMYRELIGKSTFTKMEEKAIGDENEKVEAIYYKIENIQKLKRKKVFAQTVREFKNLVVEISKMAKNINSMVKDRNIKLEQEYIDRYKFSAREFNNFLRYFRSFLDKTHCYHGVEIEHNRLLYLLIPEELPLIQEKVEKL